MRILHVCLDYPPRRTRYGSGTVNDDLLATLRTGSPARAARVGWWMRLVEVLSAFADLLNEPAVNIMRRL